MVRDPAGRTLRQLPGLTVVGKGEVVARQGEVVPRIALRIGVHCRGAEVPQYREEDKESEQKKIHDKFF